jgi:hypothetical protein
MKLNQQVCSIELAKKLKELEVKQESLFEYAVDPIEKKIYKIYRTTPLSVVKEYTHMHSTYSAFTVAELGEMLPAHYFTVKSMEKDNWWHCNNITDFEDAKRGIIGDTEADARAKMLIFLLENNLINI